MKNAYRISGVILYILSISLFTFCKKEATLPVVSTNPTTEITTTTAVSGGIITDDGGAAISSVGICWSTSYNPTIDDNKTIEAGELTSFSSNLAQLTPGTTYNTVS